MFPSILKPILRAAAAHGIWAVRNPFEAPEVVTFREARANTTLLVRKAETSLLRAMLRGRWLKAVHKAGFATTDGSLGVASTGTLDRSSLHALLQRMPEGTFELVSHPGYNDEELAQVRTKLRESREIEMSALMEISPDELRDKYGVELVSFHPESSRPTEVANI
jgi:predicted glycoside hydrolase/deacetylase ChbG (UPF0249 family)